MGKCIGVQSSSYVESDKGKCAHIHTYLKYVVKQKGLKTKISNIEATQ